MEPLHAALRIYQSEDPASAFRAMVDQLRNQLPLHGGFFVDAGDRSVLHRWPEDAEVTPDLLDTALHVIRSEIFPVGSEFPFDASRYPKSDMLLLPLRTDEERSALCILIGDADSFGEDLQPWNDLGAALQHFLQRDRRLGNAEQSCEDLRRRVEESEALHTLGLAANRTLDKDEVLNLVARFTRTLLGAHYVTVSTLQGDRTYTAASVGLRNSEGASDDYHLARTVLEAEKPLTVGGPEASLQVEHFPFHAQEGMKVGLGIPLSLFGDTFGALVVGYRREYEVTPRDIRLALTLAGHAAVAISNARLHENVEQRSEELEAAYQELNRATEAKERFFASINHELRNPLGAIIGYQSLLLDGTGGELPPTARSYLEKAHRGANTLRALVNDILDLSKIAAGKMDLEPRPCAVEELLEGVLNTIQPLADEMGVALSIPPLADIPVLRTDPHRAQQILVNLFSNAVKFTGEGGVSLSVATIPAAAGEDPEAAAVPGWVELRVTDTGEGIAPENLDLIFEEFEQIKGTKGGTGLGLPISRRLARLLGGELWAESEVGVGSTFVLRLPSETVVAAEVEERVESEVA